VRRRDGSGAVDEVASIPTAALRGARTGWRYALPLDTALVTARVRVSVRARVGGKKRGSHGTVCPTTMPCSGMGWRCWAARRRAVMPATASGIPSMASSKASRQPWRTFSVVASMRQSPNYSSQSNKIQATRQLIELSPPAMRIWVVSTTPKTLSGGSAP